MQTYAYLFEAKSIQSYLLTTNRLREIVGGSEMVEALTGAHGLLDDALGAVGGRIAFSRRGGGAFFAFSEDESTRDRLADLWPLLVRQYAPDLEFVQARGQGDSAKAAYDDGHARLLADRNRPQVRYPPAAPLAVRNRRSGEPATTRMRSKKGSDPEPVDAATARKLNDRFWKGVALGRRFAWESPWESWPLNLAPADGDDDERSFPFLGEDHTLALVHADGNGLGELLITLNQAVAARPGDYVEIFRAFSEAVSTATERAAQAATRAVLDDERVNGVYPARPIVLGGDDLTMLVRADLALPFTRAFLVAFATESEIALRKPRERFGLNEIPERLTACAGIAYAKASQPFYLLHELAEGLCKHAKVLAKGTRGSESEPVPAALSFHRVTTACVDAFPIILARELTTNGLRQTLECYAVARGSKLPALDDLLGLQSLLADQALARGATRELLGLVGRAPAQAARHYARWRAVMTDKQHGKLKAFDDLLASLGVAHRTGQLPYRCEVGDAIGRSPLGDVLTLNAVGSRLAPATNATQEPNP